MGTLFMATPEGLLSTDGVGRSITPIANTLNPPLQDVNALDVADGVLWSFGTKDIAFFDGQRWTRIHDLDNPRIGP